MYLKVSISDFLTLFSSRTVGWFWSSLPGTMLLAGAGLALSLSTALACAWPHGNLHGIEVEGLALGEYRLWPLWVWLYCIVWWFIQDACKVGAPPRARRTTTAHCLLPTAHCPRPGAPPHARLAACATAGAHLQAHRGVQPVRLQHRGHDQHEGRPQGGRQGAQAGARLRGHGGGQAAADEGARPGACLAAVLLLVVLALALGSCCWCPRASAAARASPPAPPSPPRPQVDNARRDIDKMVQSGHAPNTLARLSQAMARTGALARTSVGPTAAAGARPRRAGAAVGSRHAAGSAARPESSSQQALTRRRPALPALQPPARMWRLVRLPSWTRSPSCRRPWR
jgi:hypothetical protein